MGHPSGPMTEAMYYILLALGSPGHGYQLMARVEELSHHRLRMGPGTLYGVLSRLEEEGLILLAQEQGRRKVYRLSPAGEDALKAEYRRLCALVEDGQSAFKKEGTDRGCE